MTGAEPTWLVAMLFCFCRIGACFMAMPGVPSPRVTMRFRLAMAVGISILFGPLIEHQVPLAVAQHGAQGVVRLAISEIAIGLSIGMVGRIFFAAVQFAGAFIAALVGLAAPAGLPIEDSEPSPPPADLMMIAALLLFFVTDLHLIMIAGVLKSYAEIPLAGLFDAELGLRRVLAVSAAAFEVAIQLASPVLVVTVILNLALGVANRMVPWLPTQFLGAPLLLLVGLGALAASTDGFLERFLEAASRMIAAP